MSRSPRSTAARSQGSARSSVPISSSICSAPARCAAVQRSRQRADRADDRGAEIGTGRRDHARGERRRVEAVVDGGDQVLLDRGRVLGLGLFAVHHVQVVRGVARDRRGARPARDLGGGATARQISVGTTAQVAIAFSRSSRRRRRSTAGNRAWRRTATRPCAGRSSGMNVSPARAIVGQHLVDRERDRASGRDLGCERLALGNRRGQIGPRTSSTRRPRADASLRGRRRCTGGSGRSLRARVRRRRSSPPRRRLRGRGAPRAPVHPQVGSSRCASGRASRRCRRGGRRRRRECGDSRVRRGARTPPALRRRTRWCRASDVIHSETFVVDASDPARRNTDHVAFGQDPGHAVVGADDDDRPDLSLAHARRRFRDGVSRLHGHDGRAHDVADGALSCRFGHGAQPTSAVPAHRLLMPST